MSDKTAAEITLDRARSYADDARKLAADPDLTTELPVTWGEVYQHISGALFDLARELEAS